jgi:hypothetical protein
MSLLPDARVMDVAWLFAVAKTGEWIWLSAVAKFCIAIAPFLNLVDEFNFTDRDRIEAQELLGASSSKAMAFSTPIILFIETLQQASTACTHRGVIAFIAVVTLALVILSFLIYKLSTDLFRGKLSPFIWLIVLLVGEALYEVFAKDRIAHLFCA